MSEFIREVDEDYRNDQIRHLLPRYWAALLALAVIVLVAAGGWRGYVYYRQQRDEAAGGRYFEATQTLAGDRAASLAALDGLAKDAPAGYRLLARFKAAAQVSQTDAVAGARAFDALGADQGIDADLREIAKLRAAMLMMDSADAAEISRRFEPLADANAPFRTIAREMLGVFALHRGDDGDAKRWFDAEASDPAAAQDARQRALLFLDVIRSGKPGEVAAAPRAPVALPPAADGQARAPAVVDAPPAVTPETPAPVVAPPSAATPPSPETKPADAAPAGETTPPAPAPPPPDQPQPAKP